MKIAGLDLQDIPNKNYIYLRRSIGKTLSEAGNAMGHFYAVKPYYVKFDEEEILFACLSMACQWKEEERGLILPFAQCLKHLVYQKELNKTSINRTMATLLDCDWNPEHGNLLGIKLARLVKQIHIKGGCSPNFEILYNDLKQWDHPDRFIQKKWARDYFTTTKFEEDNDHAL